MLGLRRVRSAWPVWLDLCLITVMLSMLGMHQLSLNHTFATPEWVGHHSRELVTASSGGPQAFTVVASLQRATRIEPRSTYHLDLEQQCSRCDRHDAMVATCLLALTLLVVAWNLRPPAGRWPFPSHTMWARGPVVLPGRWLRPALTLAELSLLRRPPQGLREVRARHRGRDPHPDLERDTPIAPSACRGNV
jgi:hypothetical protein